MFNLNIIRGKSTPEGTPGKLVSSAGFTCDTLELQWANNKTGISCINADVYNAALWFSSTLKRLVVRLVDKNGRHDCLIHNGNWAGEASGEITQIHGCTEVGKGYGQITKPDESVTQFGILNSGNTLDCLIAHISMQCGEQPFTVTYVWGEGCAPDDLTDFQITQKEGITY